MIERGAPESQPVCLVGLPLPEKAGQLRMPDPEEATGLLGGHLLLLCCNILSDLFYHRHLPSRGREAWPANPLPVFSLRSIRSALSVPNASTDVKDSALKIQNSAPFY